MTDQIVTQEEHLAALGRYEYGWADTDTAGASTAATPSIDRERTPA